MCSYEGKYCKWYLKQNGKRRYIPKNNRALAEQLAYKRYLIAYIKELETEYEASVNYYNSCSKIISANNVLIKSSEIRNLFRNYKMPISQEVVEWSRASYEKNHKYTDKRTVKCLSGNYVRSKSEAIIDMCLFNRGIPYRYENKLTLGKVTLYPDFTLRHPINGEFYYWEHYGQMDVPEYYNNVIDKTKLYISNGIIPDVNLIITCETKENPLTPDKVMKVIDTYFG